MAFKVVEEVGKEKGIFVRVVSGLSGFGLGVFLGGCRERSRVFVFVAGEIRVYRASGFGYGFIFYGFYFLICFSY